MSLPDETGGDERMVAAAAAAGTASASARKRFAVRGVGGIYLNVLERDSGSS